MHKRIAAGIRGAVSKPALVVAVVSLIGILVSPLYANGDAARPDVARLVLGAGVIAVVGIAVINRPHPSKRGVLVLVSVMTVGATGYAVWAAVDDIRSGTPGAVMPALGACLLVLSAALISNAILPREDVARAPRWRNMVAPVSAAIVLLVVGPLVSPLIPNLPESSNAAVAVAGPNVPASISDQAWLVKVPEGKWPHASENPDDFVVSAGAGFATILGYPGAGPSAVAGVDGATGELRWSYRLDGAKPTKVFSSPDGKYVATLFAPGNRFEPPVRLVVLDAMTGERLAQRVLPDQATRVLPTNEVVLLGQVRADSDEDGKLGSFTAIDLQTGEIRWSRNVPAGCSAFVYGSTAHLSLLYELCDSSRGRILALDDSDGAVRWEYSSPDLHPTGGFHNIRAGQLIAVKQVNTDFERWDILSADDGIVRASLPTDGSPFISGTTGFARTRSGLFRLDGQEWAPVELADCGDAWIHDVVATTAGVVALCATAVPRVEALTTSGSVMTRDLPESPADQWYLAYPRLFAVPGAVIAVGPLPDGGVFYAGLR
jgi:outer membrane protein assembly factor BamB